MDGLRRRPGRYLLILLAAAPAATARAQSRPPGAEVGLDVGFALLATSLGPSNTGYAASAHGGYELRFGLAPELEMGLASWSSFDAGNQSTFWFGAGLRYSAEINRFAFYASSHIGYGHMDAAGVSHVSAAGLALDFVGGLLVHTTPDVAVGPRVAAMHIDLSRGAPILASELWYEIGAAMEISFRP